MPRKTSPALAAALRVQKLIGLLLVTLVAACASLEAWPVECGSSDCSRSVPFNVSLADPYVTRRMPVVQNSMPLAYSVVTDSAGRAFVGSLDGSFTCISLASGAVQWRVALGFGPLSSAAAVYSAPAGSQGVLVMGRSGDVALLGAGTGSVVWSVSLKIPTDAAPIISGIFAYIGSRDGTLVKLNAASGQQVWFTTAVLLHGSARGATIVTQPVLSARGLLIIGFNNGLVMAINAGTAALMWRAFCLAPISGIAAPPASNRIIVTSTDGYVYSFDPSNGLRLWRNKRFASLDSAPAVSPLNGGLVYAVGSDGLVAAMTIGSGFTVWSVQLESTPTAGPVQSSNGALVVPCKNALVVLAAATGARLWSTSIVPANQVGGAAFIEAENGGVKIVLTAFDGSLILLASPWEIVQQLPTQPPPTTSVAQQPLTSWTASPPVNETDQSPVIKPPVAVPAPPRSTFPPPANTPAAVPFTGYELAVGLSATALAIVLGLAAAPFLHKVWLARNTDLVRQRKLAQSLDKAANAVQQRHIAEQGHRNSRIDDWLTNQDLPRALPALKPLKSPPRAPPSIASSLTATSPGSEFKSSSDLQRTKSAALAMKIGALPHTQWHVQRASSFTRSDSVSTKDDISVKPPLPPLPSSLQTHKK